MASITPKMSPVRKASDQRGLCSAAPLPTAAAKASVDMARERAAVAAKFIRDFQWGMAGAEAPAILPHPQHHQRGCQAISAEEMPAALFQPARQPAQGQQASQERQHHA